MGWGAQPRTAHHEVHFGVESLGLLQQARVRVVEEVKDAVAVDACRLFAPKHTHGPVSVVRLTERGTNANTGERVMWAGLW